MITTRGSPNRSISLARKRLAGLGVTLWLNENIKHVAVRVDRPPEPVFSAVDWDDDPIQVPFVDRGRSVAPDTIGKVAAKTVHPFPDCFPADHHTSIGEKVLDIRRAEREAMVDPDGICNDFTGKTVAFQARHGGWYIHTQRLTKRRTANKLAIPGAPIARMIEALVDTYWRAKTERADVTRALYSSVAEMDNDALIQHFADRTNAATQRMLDSAADARFREPEMTNRTLVTVIFGTVRNVFERNLDAQAAATLRDELVAMCCAYAEHARIEP